MKYGIIGALDEEVIRLKNSMQLERTIEACGCTYYEGKLEGKDAVVVCCSVGKVNAAVCTTILIREFGCGAVINTGIAGAMGEGLRPLGVVISSEVVIHDISSIAAKYYPYTTVFKADEGLVNAVRAASVDGAREADINNFDCRVGRIATGDQFVQGGELRDRIKREFHPEAVEMEGGAVAQACYMNDVPFVVIRTMSDSADDDAGETYDNFMERAATLSSEILRCTLRSL